MNIQFPSNSRLDTSTLGRVACSLLLPAPSGVLLQLAGPGPASRGEIQRADAPQALPRLPAQGLAPRTPQRLEAPPFDPADSSPGHWRWPAHSALPSSRAELDGTWRPLRLFHVKMDPGYPLRAKSSSWIIPTADLESLFAPPPPPTPLQGTAETNAAFSTRPLGQAVRPESQAARQLLREERRGNITG